MLNKTQDTKWSFLVDSIVIDNTTPSASFCRFCQTYKQDHSLLVSNNTATVCGSKHPCQICAEKNCNIWNSGKKNGLDFDNGNNSEDGRDDANIMTMNNKWRWCRWLQQPRITVKSNGLYIIKKMNNINCNC